MIKLLYSTHLFVHFQTCDDGLILMVILTILNELQLETSLPPTIVFFNVKYAISYLLIDL